MAAAPPQPIDPSFVYLTMPQPPPSTPVTAQQPSRALEIFKICLHFLIALLLCAILLVVVVGTHSSNGVNPRASNEKIAQLQRESEEKTARLQRESTENLTQLLQAWKLHAEDQRLERHQDFLGKQRDADRTVEAQRRQQDLSLAMETLRQHLQIEERRIQVLLQDRQIAEEHHREDLSNANENLLAAFTEEVMSAKEPLKESFLQLKIESLLRRLDPSHKSSLVAFLYKMKYLHVEGAPLDLQGANLKDLDLDDVNPQSDQAGRWLNYTQLFLPSTTLINASFQQIDLNQANFSSSNLIGASFRGSNVVHADFSRATLTMAHFLFGNISHSDFSSAKMQRAQLQNTNLFRARLVKSDSSGANFRDMIATEAVFSESELSNSEFHNSDLFQTQMDFITARSANFHNVHAAQANFTGAYLSSCIFTQANLTGASFRKAFVAGSNFDYAHLENVDFTNAILVGASFTPQQLDGALSIANTLLPDGSRGKNKNLVNNSDALCEGVSNPILHWNNSGDVFTVTVQAGTNCVFQASRANATLQQRVDVRRYERLIRHEPSKVYIEMQGTTTSGSINRLDPPVYMNVRFFDSQNNENGPEQSTLHNTQMMSASTLIASLPCPSTTVELHVTLVFKEVNATVDNIYVTIE